MDSQQAPRKLSGKREDLTGEHRVGDIGQVVLAVLFMTIWITVSSVISTVLVAIPSTE